MLQYKKLNEKAPHRRHVKFFLIVCRQPFCFAWIIPKKVIRS